MSSKSDPRPAFVILRIDDAFIDAYRQCCEDTPDSIWTIAHTMVQPKEVVFDEKEASRLVEKLNATNQTRVRYTYKQIVNAPKEA